MIEIIFLGLALFFLTFSLWKQRAVATLALICDTLAGIFSIMSLVFFISPIPATSAMSTIIYSNGSTLYDITSNTISSSAPNLASPTTLVIYAGFLLLLAFCAFLTLWDLYSSYFARGPKIPQTPRM